MARKLEVAPDVAQLIDAGTIAHLEEVAQETDNPCPFCEQYVTTDVVSLVIMRDGLAHLGRLSHPDCARSGIYDIGGIADVLERKLDGDAPTRTKLGLRETAPRALAFIDFVGITSGVGSDFWEDHAKHVGLEPCAGEIEAISPDPAEHARFRIEDRELRLYVDGELRETIGADVDELRDWRAEAERDGVVLITGRGLGLAKERPTIEEALRERPTWAGVIRLGRRPRRRWLGRLSRPS
jgi:hypothetical protein